MNDYVNSLPSRRVAPGPGGAGRSHYVVGAKGLKIIEELSARGVNLITIAKALRMSKDAFIACRHRQPEVEEALERGRAQEHDALVSNLRTAADEGNVIANLFLLKARHGYREGVPLEVNVAVNTSGVIVVPARMTVEGYLAMKREEGMIDVTRPPRNTASPQPDESGKSAPSEDQPEAPIPENRRAPSGTTVAQFPSLNSKHRDSL